MGLVLPIAARTHTPPGSPTLRPAGQNQGRDQAPTTHAPLGGHTGDRSSDGVRSETMIFSKIQITKKYKTNTQKLHFCCFFNYPKITQNVH